MHKLDIRTYWDLTDIKVKISEINGKSIFKDWLIYYTMVFPNMLLLLGGTKTNQNRDLKRSIEWLKKLKI